MSTDGPRQSNQRFSRFSRDGLDEILPPRPPEEPSLTDIAMRALSAGAELPQRALIRQQEWDQPPPPEPEPGTYWRQEEPASPPPMRSAIPDLLPQPRPPAPAPRGNEWAEPGPRSLRDAPPMPPQDAVIPIPDLAPTPKASPRRKRREPAEEVAKGPGAVARAMTIARSKVAPALVNSAFWLAHNLQRREIRKRYARALVLGHGKIVDRQLEKLFFVPTTKSATINPAPERGIHYDGPVPSAVFDWIMAAMPKDLRQFAFVDIRAGRGRSSLLASKWKFSRIIAYEYDPEVFDDLQMNIAQYPRSLMACRRIDCSRGDVDGIRLPDQPCIIYFSGAWRERMIPGVMSYVRETYRHSPRPIYIVLENADEETAIPEDRIFERIEPPLAERMKLKLLSPMDIRIYRSML